jgi:hypothetical protein
VLLAVFTVAGSILIIGTTIAVTGATMAGLDAKLKSVFGVPLEREQLAQVPAPKAKPARKRAATRKAAPKKE